MHNHIKVMCIKGLLHTDRLQGLKELVQQKKNVITILSNQNWLLKRGYREDHVDSEIERIKLVERTLLFQIRDRKKVMII